MFVQPGFLLQGPHRERRHATPTAQELPRPTPERHDPTPGPGAGTEAGNVGTAIGYRLRLAFTTAALVDPPPEPASRRSAPSSIRTPTRSGALGRSCSKARPSAWQRLLKRSDAPGRTLVQWFHTARLELLRGLVEAEATGDGTVVSEAQLTAHVDDAPRRFPKVGRTWEQFEEGLAAFPWGANITFLSGQGELLTRGRTSSLHVLGGGSAWRASAAVTVNAPDDAPSCRALVDFLHTALDPSAPAFGRIEGNSFHVVGLGASQGV